MDKIIQDALMKIGDLRTSDNSLDLGTIRNYCMTLESRLSASNDLHENDYIADIAYCLIAAIDESILSNSLLAPSWMNQPMLQTIYQDNNGGTRFYNIIKRYTKNPSSANSEIKRACLAILLFGFEGRNSLDSHSKSTLIAELYTQTEAYYKIPLNITSHQFTSAKRTWPLKTFVILSLSLIVFDYTYINYAVAKPEHSLLHILKAKVNR